MARPTVPHCTDCKHYRDLRHFRDKKGLHVCFYFGSNYERRKIISGQEVRHVPFGARYVVLVLNQLISRLLQEDAKTPGFSASFSR